ncbi:hypothetical protein HDU98_006824 [Podochytrium sp. JEL0797]|nr:hypothetical protein HDU98_006824 [Podochytrium sp. JEL0797]
MASPIPRLSSEEVSRMENMLNELELEIGTPPLRSMGRSLTGSRRPSVAQSRDDNTTIARLLEHPSALSGQLELYIPPTHGDEGMLVERFFVLVARSVYMFVSRSSQGKPLGQIDLTAGAFVMGDIHGATDRAFELVGEAGPGMFKTWVLCAKTIQAKHLWMEMINHAITSCIDEAAKFAAAMPSRQNSFPMNQNNRSLSNQGVEYRSNMFNDQQYDGSVRFLQRKQFDTKSQHSGANIGLDVQYNFNHRRDSDSSLFQASPASLGSSFPGNATQDDNIFFEASRKMNSHYSVSSNDSTEKPAEPVKKIMVKRRVKTAMMGVL